jgi:hypothetical protein
MGDIPFLGEAPPGLVEGGAQGNALATTPAVMPPLRMSKRATAIIVSMLFAVVVRQG